MKAHYHDEDGAHLPFACVIQGRHSTRKREALALAVNAIGGALSQNKYDI